MGSSPMSPAPPAARGCWLDRSAAASDAEIFAEDFETVGIEASNFTNSQADRIAPLAGE